MPVVAVAVGILFAAGGGIWYKAASDQREAAVEAARLERNRESRLTERNLSFHSCFLIIHISSGFLNHFSL